ncbi:MAG TPA: Maf family protein, partial [Salinimicrobium sp.]|nr:Maf family protein [Salinimicrobium sp.]
MLKEKLKDYHIILASGSPRRHQFFKELEINFEVRPKPIEETYPKHLKRSEITDFLADLKAAAFEGELKNNDILVTSDTIV